MPVQIIDLKEVQVFEITDEALEQSSRGQQALDATTGNATGGESCASVCGCHYN
jgi:hypothetical protein